MKNILKKIFGVLLISLLIMQLIPRPKKNVQVGINTNDISTAYKIPVSVKDILQQSCYDCHSNTTNYPWYASVQPVSMWLDNHIQEGKEELNFSEFGTYSIKRKLKKLKEINKEVKEGEMPLSSYTIIHRNAVLTEQEKIEISNWTVQLSTQIAQAGGVPQQEEKIDE